MLFKKVLCTITDWFMIYVSSRFISYSAQIELLNTSQEQHWVHLYKSWYIITSPERNIRGHTNRAPALEAEAGQQRAGCDPVVVRKGAVSTDEWQALPQPVSLLPALPASSLLHSGQEVLSVTFSHPCTTSRAVLLPENFQ